MMDKSLDERFDNIRKRLEILVNQDFAIVDEMKTTSEQLSRKFNLSSSQAKAWLKREPNYVADDILQRKRTDGDLTEPREPSYLYCRAKYFY
jgi:hypothetical protein